MLNNVAGIIAGFKAGEIGGDMPSPNRGWMREQLAGVLNAFSISSI